MVFELISIVYFHEHFLKRDLTNRIFDTILSKRRFSEIANEDPVFQPFGSCPPRNLVHIGVFGRCIKCTCTYMRLHQNTPQWHRVSTVHVCAFPVDHAGILPADNFPIIRDHSSFPPRRPLFFPGKSCRSDFPVFDRLLPLCVYFLVCALPCISAFY